MILPDKIIRSKKRTTVSLSVRPGGEFVVRAPFGVSDEAIKRIILKKDGWVKAAVLRQKNAPAGEKLAVRERVLVFGEEIKISFGKFDKAVVRQENGEKLLLLPKEQPFEAFYKFSKEILADILGAKVESWSKRLGVCPSAINVTRAVSRYGSCNSKRSLNFSFTLAQAPIYVIDYVVVHEMTHILYYDHSADFWAAVERAYPKTEAAKKWLKEHGGELVRR